MSISSDGSGQQNIEAGIRALADSLGEGLAVIQQGRIVFLNDRLLEITGIPRHEIEGQPLAASFSTAEDGERYTSIQAKRELGEDVGFTKEVQFVTRNGRYIELRNRSSVVSWQGKPATVHFLDDITQSKETERRLREQREVNSILTDTVNRILASPLSLEETAGTILDSAMALTESRSGVLVIMEGDEEVILQNRCQDPCEACRLPKVYREIIKDSSLMETSRPGRTKGSFYLNKAVTTGAECHKRPQTMNLLQVPAWDSNILIGRIILADAEDSFGPWDLDNLEKIAEVLSLARIRLSAVEALQHAKINAEKENEARSIFLANVSHEIRAPLNGVLMMASLLEDSDLSTDQSELLGIIKFSARTIDRLIRDLTDLNQINTGQFAVYNEDFDFDELCRRILETHRPEALRKGLSLGYEVSPDVTRYYGDKERVGQVIANLVVNAIKYTIKGHVRLEVDSTGDAVRICVSDTGVGIPADQHKAVFESFQRGRTGSNLRVAGMGIGLSVVKELTAAMDGEVELESSPDEGSRFLVYLPLDNRSDSMVRSPVLGSNSDLPDSARILIAEDDGVNRLYLRTLLAREGMIVDEAVDGLEVVSLAKKGSYHLVLMDINMPRMDGIEASSHIRKIQPELPIIAITANAYEEDRYKILEAGFVDIMRKPLDEIELKENLRRYLRK